jgi:hypothetical protein
MRTARSVGEASPPGDTPGSTPAGHRVRRGTGPARMRRAATGGAVLASRAVLVAWLIASAPPLQTVEAATAWPRPTNSPWMRL